MAAAVDTTSVVPPHELAEEPFTPDLTFWARTKQAPVHTIPMQVIRRPVACHFEEDRVQTYMRELRVSNDPLISESSLNLEGRGQDYSYRIIEGQSSTQV